MADDVVLNKAGSIERCIARIREVSAIHDCAKLNLDIVKHAIMHRLDDFLAFTSQLLKKTG